jgi:hypothetical protein
MKLGDKIWWQSKAGTCFGVVHQFPTNPKVRGVWAERQDNGQIDWVDSPHRVREEKSEVKLTKHAPWTFENFMDELNNPSAAMSVLLHGLGVSIGQLPKSDPNATPIDKLYF